MQHPDRPGHFLGGVLRPSITQCRWFSSLSSRIVPVFFLFLTVSASQLQTPSQNPREDGATEGKRSKGAAQRKNDLVKDAYSYVLVSGQYIRLALQPSQSDLRVVVKGPGNDSVTEVEIP